VKKINGIIAVLKRISTDVRSQWRVLAGSGQNCRGRCSSEMRTLSRRVTANYLYPTLLDGTVSVLKSAHSIPPI